MFRVANSHLKTQDVCVCRKGFLEEHVFSLGRLQAITVGEKLATLGWVFEGVARIQISSMTSPLTDKALS